MCRPLCYLLCASLLPFSANAEVVCALRSGAFSCDAKADQRLSGDAMQLAGRTNAALSPTCSPKRPQVAIYRNPTAANAMLVVTADQAKFVYAPQFFTVVYDQYGDGAIIAIIAHEYGHALHILDRFHIMAKMSKALDEVRAQETKRLIRDGYQPLLKKSRWCVLKRKENLTAKQQVRLRDLLRYNLQTGRAYLLKEDFQQFWTYSSPVWAGKFLDFWCHQVMRSRIEPMPERSVSTGSCC